MLRPALCLAGLALLLASCARGGDPDIAEFQTQWHAAINAREYERLYALLDLAGRRRFAQQLEEMRGLKPEAQQYVIDQLGGERISSLHALTPAEYFARLWRLTTGDRRPAMTLRDHGNGLGEMELTLDDKQLVIELAVEQGQWVWRLPAQHFEPPNPPAELR